MTTLHEAMESLEEEISPELREDWDTFKNYLNEVETNYMILHQQMTVLRKAIRIVGDPIEDIQSIYRRHVDARTTEHLQPPGEPDLGERS